jgi:hypothetical protein
MICGHNFGPSKWISVQDVWDAAVGDSESSNAMVNQEEIAFKKAFPIKNRKIICTWI